MILANEIYFALPIDFNDPFDCNISPEMVYTPQEYENFVSSIDQRKNGYPNQDEIEQLLQDPVKVLEKNWIESISSVRNNVRVCCLSSVNDSVMMFSHYADSHKGICLEFKVVDDPFFSELNYVRYVDKIPVFHPFIEDVSLAQRELVEIEVLTKSKTWCYEEEWRVIKSGPNPSIHKFPVEILTSIIFGYQTPKEDKLLIAKIIDKREASIQLKDAVKKEKSFDIEIRPYSA